MKVDNGIGIYNIHEVKVSSYVWKETARPRGEREREREERAPTKFAVRL